MRNLPDGLAAAIARRESVLLGLRARLVRGSQQLDPRAVGATIAYDAQDVLPWSGSLTIRAPGDPRLLLPTGIVAPFGTEALVWAVVQLANGDTYEVQASRQLVTAVDYDQADQLVQLRLVDLGERVERYRFERPYTTPAGDVADVVNAVVANRTGVSPQLDPTGVTMQSTTLGTEPERGPWTELRDLTSTRGLTLAYDYAGTLTLTPEATTYVGPVEPLGLRSVLDQLPPNLIVARGEPQDDTPPSFAIAEDDDPSSPWFVDGPYGRVTGYYASPLLDTDALAQSAAATNLASRLTSSVLYDVGLGFDLATEPRDVLGLYGTRAEVVATSLQLPSGAKTAAARFLL